MLALLHQIDDLNPYVLSTLILLTYTVFNCYTKKLNFFLKKLQHNRDLDQSFFAQIQPENNELQ